jgi:hypothetical protein
MSVAGNFRLEMLIPARTRTTRFVSVKFEPGLAVPSAPQRTGSARHWQRILKTRVFPTELSDFSLYLHLFAEIRRSLRGAYPAAVVLDRMIWIIGGYRTAGASSATVVLSR